MPWEELVEFVRNRRISNPFVSVISCNPKVYAFVHDHIPPGYYRCVGYQRRKANSPSDEPTTLE